MGAKFPNYQPGDPRIEKMAPLWVCRLVFFGLTVPFWLPGLVWLVLAVLGHKV